MRAGLESLWKKLNQIYYVDPDVYDRGSELITFGLIRKWRREALSLDIAPNALVLDAGSGRGAMSDVLRSAGISPIMMDASYNMLSRGQGDRVQAVFEAMPFRRGVFDYVIMSFSLHASMDYLTTLTHVRRSARKGGYVFIINIGKPSSPLKRALCALYLKVGLPLTAMVLTGKNYRLFLDIRTIYGLSPPNDSFLKELGQMFKTVDAKEYALGMVFKYLGQVGRSTSPETALGRGEVPWPDRRRFLRPRGKTLGSRR